MTKTNNRKTKYFSNDFEYNGEKFKIIDKSDKLGIYKEILITSIEQLDLTIKIHKKVLVLRLELHLNYYTDDNKRISNFMKNIKVYLARNYKIHKLGFIWVREIEKSKKQHYHLALFLDGNKIQHPKKLNEIIKEKWLPFGSTWKPKHCYYYIDKNNIKEQRVKAIYRVSYLAKIRCKGYRNKQTKDYGASRLKI